MNRNKENILWSNITNITNKVSETKHEINLNPYNRNTDEWIMSLDLKYEIDLEIILNVILTALRRYCSGKDISSHILDGVF